MSELGVNPLGGLPEDISESAARDHTAALVRGDAISVTEANATLVAKGWAPLNENAADYFATRKEALLNDNEFIAAYGRGDPGAISSLYQLDLRISQASGNLTDRALSPNDAIYDGLRREVGQHVQGEGGTAYGQELAGLAASIGLPASNAQHLAENHFAALKAQAGMTVEEQQTWGNQQSAAFHAALGPHAEAQITEASKVLSEKFGKQLDLAKIVRSNGVAAAITLLFQAQVLAKGLELCRHLSPPRTNV